MNEQGSNGAPSSMRVLLARVFSLVTQLAIASPVLYAVYLCVRPIFEDYGTLLGIVSILPFAPLTVLIMPVALALDGRSLPLVLIIGTGLIGYLLHPLAALIHDSIFGVSQRW